MISAVTTILHSPDPVATSVELLGNKLPVFLDTLWGLLEQPQMLNEPAEFLQCASCVLLELVPTEALRRLSLLVEDEFKLSAAPGQDGASRKEPEDYSLVGPDGIEPMLNLLVRLEPNPSRVVYYLELIKVHELSRTN